MTCQDCKEDILGGFMCDQQEDDGVRCSSCFEKLGCTEESHGEGCVTGVFEGD